MKFSPANTKIAVIGGGNIGTQFACICAAKGFSVNILSSQPNQFNNTLIIVDEFENTIYGKINRVSSHMEDIITNCNIVFVTHPAFNLKSIADQILPYITKETIICVLPGTGGAEFSFRECIKAGATLIGLQRVPSVARLEQYGNKVRCEGLRNELFMASIPACADNDFADFLSFLWDIPCTILPNYLCVTLTPSNPLLHTTRLKTLFSDYENGLIYDRNPLFYGEWDDNSSELLIACDNELQEMILLLDKLDLHYVRPLTHHYDSNSPQAMTRKIQSIKSLHRIYSPMIKIESGWIPDFTSRYFTADFPYGLAIIEELADLIGYNATNIRKTMNWYRSTTGDLNRLELSKYGIHNIEDIYFLYTNNLNG